MEEPDGVAPPPGVQAAKHNQGYRVYRDSLLACKGVPAPVFLDPSQKMEPR